MFSIENLLSNKYTSKSLQNVKNREPLDSHISATMTSPISRKTSHSRGGSDTRREVNNFAGKRDTLYLELSAAAIASNARTTTEGDMVERDTKADSDIMLSSWSKMAVKEGDLQEREIRSVDKGLEGSQKKISVERRCSRKRRSDGGEEESESELDERDSASEYGTIFYLHDGTSYNIIHVTLYEKNSSIALV